MADKILDEIATLIEAARQEAYAAGYNDALKQIVSAASAMPKSGPPPARERNERRRGVPPSPEVRKRAPRGQVEEQVTRILAGETEGLTIRDIEERSEASGAAAKQPSIRVALLRLEQAGKATRDGRRWRLCAEEPAHAATLSAAPGDGPEAEPSESEEPSLAAG